jgi:uncharacterized membrane protein
VTRARFGAAGLLAVVLLTGLTLLLGYANKARCAGPEFDASGRTLDFGTRQNRDVCYSDIQYLWIGRSIDTHVFPYVHGGITADGQLTGGAVEYPVLSGVLIWLGALGADTDAGFLLGSALLLAPFGLLTGWMLGRLARWRALLWALGPPLVLYSFHNWDLPAVAAAVAAVWVVHTRRDTTLAAVLLGVGCALKLYPGAFLLPLALYVLSRPPLHERHLGETPSPRGTARAGGLDWLGALRVLGVGLGTVVLVNLPFALAGYEGWRASFTFQENRAVDVSTNSIWFWGLRPLMDEADFAPLVDVLSPMLVLVSFAVAAAVGWRIHRRGAEYPWIQVSAAMLCGFLLLHKVHSPQYTLWLLPFFVLLRIRWGWVAAYLVADVLMGIGIFRWFYALNAGLDGGIAGGLAAQAVVLGVWGRAALLVILSVMFLKAPSLSATRTPAAPGGPPASTARAAAPPAAGTSPHPSVRG